MSPEGCSTPRLTDCQSQRDSDSEVYVVQADANGFLHKMVHIARRPVQNLVMSPGGGSTLRLTD
jgi:hypothetical protein